MLVPDDTKKHVSMDMLNKNAMCSWHVSAMSFTTAKAFRNMFDIEDVNKCPNTRNTRSKWEDAKGMLKNKAACIGR